MCLAPEEDDEEWCEAGGITLIGEDEEVDMTLALEVCSPCSYLTSDGVRL